MSKTRSQGFTLIELLVVIAIIGILSAVVLASLSTARQKGQDAAVQSDLATIQTQAEIYYGANGNSYGTLAYVNTTAAACTGGAAGSSIFAAANNPATVANALTGAYTSSGSASGNVVCEANGTGYFAAVKLSATTTTAYWCVDSTGVAKTEYAVPGATATQCP